MARLFKRFIAITMIGIICFTQSMLAQKALFMDIGSLDLAKMNSAQQGYLNHIQTAPTTERCRVVQVSSLDHLRVQPNVLLNVFPNLQFDFNKVKMEAFKDGLQVWQGKYSDGNATIVIENGSLTGNIRVNGQLYQIKPLSGGLHAIVQFDVAALPPEHGEDYPEGVEEDNSEALQEMLKAKAQMEDAPSMVLKPQSSTIDVMAVYSNQMARANANPRSIVRLAVSETNQSYGNSNISISVRLAYSGQVNYNDTGDLRIDARALRSGIGNSNALRDQYGADLCVIIVENGNYCGLALGQYVSASNAFCAVKTSCATGYYSFGHELGHLQGVDHDRANGSNSRFSDGYGYIYPSGGWRTVMAYNSASRCCTRLPYWSNPNIYYGGVPMGNSNAYNARVLKATVNYISGFRAPFDANPFTKKDKGLQGLSHNFALHQNYPNPFNPSTTIRYTLKKASQVSLIIYDASGKQVRQLLNGSQAAGNQSIVWDGKNDAGQSAASGSYFYHITADGFKAVKQMQLLK